MCHIGFRQVQHGDQRQQHDPHRIGRDFAPEDRFGNARPSLQRSSRDDEQSCEDQKRSELLQPNAQRRFAECARYGLSRKNRQDNNCHRGNGAHQR